MTIDGKILIKILASELQQYDKNHSILQEMFKIQEINKYKSIYQ